MYTKCEATIKLNIRTNNYIKHQIINTARNDFFGLQSFPKDDYETTHIEQFETKDLNYNSRGHRWKNYNISDALITNIKITNIYERKDGSCIVHIKSHIAL
jgi:oxalate decarboxylase/phosphoglucose isomerase-like protein (cupin superfamily)